MNHILKKSAALLLAGQMFLSTIAPIAAMAEPYSYSGGMFSTPSRGYNSSGQAQGMPSYGMPLDTYFTDNSGNILMYINVLGEVTKPGQFIIRQDADFVTLLSVVGGANKDADLKRTRLMRYKADKGEQLTYTVDLEAYLEDGDRGGFVDLRPNDTIVIPKDEGLKFGDVARYAGFAVSILTLVYLIERN